MKKLGVLLSSLLGMCFIYTLQLFVINPKTLFGVKPNLILIAVIVVSLWFGLYKGTIFSFLIGMITDYIFGSNFGIFTIAYTICGMLVGYVNENYRKENKMSLVYVTLMATITFEVIQYFEYLLITHLYSSIWALGKQIILSLLLNIVIVYVVYGLVHRITQYFGNRMQHHYRGN